MSESTTPRSCAHGRIRPSLALPSKWASLRCTDVVTMISPTLSFPMYAATSDRIASTRWITMLCEYTSTPLTRTVLCERSRHKARYGSECADVCLLWRIGLVGFSHSSCAQLCSAVLTLSHVGHIQQTDVANSPSQVLTSTALA
ncbi:uncharacterized protein UMAG_11524 [Mycosarcoma maydis]|uniref:Uncharacterized protein n=1 Tax=Mycosarcoma maydis TaxID=5270 RepID=A0A0D1DUD7_MYCMD|nr:uncharacterized protein UMAG_11524 [Ustilago maydis 521]KIS67904.1 hypothetical protein UMAG_11524 [Ustilago maydis 521]|eukprot:XP_011390566.1 hypothetical protein UMAG_11524 [Ustilago maydis 521]